MNRLPLAGAALAIPLVAAVAYAASPSTAPYASPIGSPMASATLAPASPGTSPSAPPKATTAPAKPSQTWNAQVQPVTITGNATVEQQADGTGIVTLQLTGLTGEVNWSVDIQAGTIEMPAARSRIGLKSGDDVQKVAPDTIKVHLTKAEMDAFLKAQQSSGVVIFVSDGTRLSAAVFGGK